MKIELLVLLFKEEKKVWWKGSTSRAMEELSKCRALNDTELPRKNSNLKLVLAQTYVSTLFR